MTTQQLLTPRRRGLLFLDSHPTGCAQAVRQMWGAVPPGRPSGDAPVAVVVGCSAGYGLAAMVTGLARVGVRGIGVCLEQAPTARRTGTAGWYKVGAVAELARQHERQAVFLNGDAFSDEVKRQVADLVRERFDGRVDYLIYAVAAPRRRDPETGVLHSSVLKPVGDACRTRTLAFEPDGPELREVELEPATPDEIMATAAVMGGTDWDRWVKYLADQGLWAEGCATAALSYIGSPLTADIYRRGTIGVAKADLEAVARTLNQRLGALCGGRAVTSVNGAAVTQSSSAIPGIALYVGLLRAVLGDRMVPPVDQLTSLWDQLTGVQSMVTDDEGRVRLDTWELADDVHAEMTRRWQAATNDTVGRLADLDWFQDQVHQLYGWRVPGVDYQQPVETDVPWPSEGAACPT